MLNATAHRRPRGRPAIDRSAVAHPGLATPRKTDAVDAHIGKAIRAHRAAARLSMEGLAQRLGLTFQQVQKYENGTNRVAASRLVAIAQALETTPAALLPSTDPARRRRAADLEATLAAVHGLIDQHKVSIAALDDVAATLARAALLDAGDE